MQHSSCNFTFGCARNYLYVVLFQFVNQLLFELKSMRQQYRHRVNVDPVLMCNVDTVNVAMCSYIVQIQINVAPIFVCSANVDPMFICHVDYMCNVNVDPVFICHVGYICSVNADLMFMWVVSPGWLCKRATREAGSHTLNLMC